MAYYATERRAKEVFNVSLEIVVESFIGLERFLTKSTARRSTSGLVFITAATRRRQRLHHGLARRKKGRLSVFVLYC